MPSIYKVLIDSNSAYRTELKSTPESANNHLVLLIPEGQCTQSINKIINGGGYDTTNWIDSDSNGLADDWTSVVDINWYGTGGTGSGSNVLTIQTGTSYRAQRIVSTLTNSTMGALKSHSFNVSKTGTKMSYRLKIKYKNVIGSGEIAVWGYWQNNTPISTEALKTLAYTTSIVETTIEFCITNTDSQYFQYLLIGHSHPSGTYTFGFEIQEINLWECVNITCP